jgi:hypothetical protein
LGTRFRKAHRHALDYELLDLLRGLLLQRHVRDAPAVAIPHRADDVLDHRNRRRVHRKDLEAEADEHDRVDRIGSHLAAHRHRNSGAFARVDDSFDEAQERGMQRLVQIADVLVRAVDRE